MGKIKIQSIDTRLQDALNNIRSFIKVDGGDIELVKVENNKVYIKFKGACVGCPLSFLTLSSIVEETIKEKVPEVSEIIVVD